MSTNHISCRNDIQKLIDEFTLSEDTILSGKMVQTDIEKFSNDVVTSVSKNNLMTEEEKVKVTDILSSIEKGVQINSSAKVTTKDMLYVVAANICQSFKKTQNFVKFFRSRISEEYKLQIKVNVIKAQLQKLQKTGIQHLPTSAPTKNISHSDVGRG